MQTIVSRFETRERAEKYANALANGADLIIGALHEITNAAKKFNGKKYTKRFPTYVNSVLYERFGVNYYEDAEGRAYKQPKITVHLREKNHYASGCEIVFLIRLDKRSVNLDETRSVATYFASELQDYLYTYLDDEGRIDAERMENSARAMANVVLQTQQRYLEAIKFWDKNVQILAEIDEYIRERIGEVNCLFVRGDNQYFLNPLRVRIDSKK